MIAEGLIDPNHFYGTINCNGVNAKGDVCGVTTTSGLAWKIPGRVGDSPILGAGLYVDNEVGAAGSTGRGEANLYNLCSFLIVEEMRRGAHPKDAGMAALRRIKSNTIEKRLLNSRGEPNFNINFYVLNKKGEHAGVTMYGGQDVTVLVLRRERRQDDSDGARCCKGKRNDRFAAQFQSASIVNRQSIAISRSSISNQQFRMLSVAHSPIDSGGRLAGL